MKQEKQAHKTSIGGQALIEGVMMRGPKTTAMAVRNPEGEIVLEKWDTPANKKAKIFKLPFIRGIFNMVDSLRFGYKCLMRSAEIAGLEEEENEQDEKKNKFIMGILMVFSVVLAVFLSVGLFIYLPSLLFKLLANAVPSLDNRIWRGIFEGCLRIVIFVGYMCIMLLMKDIRRTFMYHGAEHKTIFCYEAGLELSVENVRKMRRFHPRCGTSFLLIVMVISILMFSLFSWKNVWIRIGYRLLLLPVVAGVSYEITKIAGKKPNGIVGLLTKPGLWLQKLTTREPDKSQREVAIVAMKAVIPENKEDDKW